MATYIEPVADLNIISTYKDLMKASTAQGSVYLHAKETLQSLMNGSDMTAAEKASVISQTIGSIATQMTNSALSAAIQLEQDRRDAPYQLAKVRAETELIQAQTDKMGNDVLASAANVDKIKADIAATKISGWKVQADIFTKNGVNVTGQDLSDAILNIDGLPSNVNAGDKVGAEQVRAGIYKTLASSARVDGNVSITTDINGAVQSLTPQGDMRDTLTGAQTKVAVRQEKGFDDNKMQHAANSSATMIGTLLSTENLDLLQEQGSVNDVTLWRTAVTHLTETTTV